MEYGKLEDVGGKLNEEYVLSSTCPVVLLKR